MQIASKYMKECSNSIVRKNVKYEMVIFFDKITFNMALVRFSLVDANKSASFQTLRRFWNISSTVFKSTYAKWCNPFVRSLNSKRWSHLCEIKQKLLLYIISPGT